MTINQCITKVRTLKPNAIDDTIIVGWLSEIEQMIYEETMRWHHGAPGSKPFPYDPDTDMDIELFVEDPYSDLYTKYVIAQIDSVQKDIRLYNNAMTQYNAALDKWKQHYNRTHMPKQDTFVRT